MSAIAADDIRADTLGSEIVVSARIRAPIALPERMWFAVPAFLFDRVAVDADAFLPVLMVVGMAHGLDVEAPDVSARLVEGCDRIMRVYESWSAARGDGLARIRLHAPSCRRQGRGHVAGALFSGGVDSTYTVLRNHDVYPPGNSRRIQCLVIGHGLDVPLDNAQLFAEVLAGAREFARAHGVELVPVRTNAREFTTGIDWGRYAHGAPLAALGHLLSPMIHTMYVASSHWVTALFPWASHPDIDQWWSSARIEFVHDGLEATRAEKVRRIALSRVALRTLRVCWRNWDGKVNCGQCEKCLRTMVALSCCGALEHAVRFPARLEPDMISHLPLRDDQVPFWEDNLALAREVGHDLLVEVLARKLYGARLRQSVRKMVVQWLNRIGSRRIREHAGSRTPYRFG